MTSMLEAAIAKACPSTHCNRAEECRSPHECCSPKRAPETVEIGGVWYDRRDTVEALTGLLAEARGEAERLRNIVAWSKRRLAPTYHQYVDGMLRGELPVESK